MTNKITGASPTGEPVEPRRGQKPLATSIPPYVWLTPKQMEERYGLSTTYWYLRRDDGTGPPFQSMGARTILYRLDLVEAWFAEREVYGFDDPKYKEIVALRKAKKAKKAEAKQSSAKAPKAQAMPLLSTFSQLRLGQLRSGAPGSRYTRFVGSAQSGCKSVPQTATSVAQSVIATLFPKLICSPSESSCFSMKEVRLPAQAAV